MKLPASIKFVAVLIAIGAVIALIAFGVSLFKGTGQTSISESRVNPFTALFPFLGGAPAQRPGTATPDSGLETQNSGGPVPRLRKVADGPVSGARFVGTSTIRYIAKETGHIFDTPADSNAGVRISNTTVPGIAEVLWVGESRFIGRFIQADGSMQNIVAEIATSAPEQSIGIESFPTFARGAISTDGSLMLTVTESSGSSRIETRDPKKPSSPRTVTVSPLRSWVPLVGGKNLFIETAPASGEAGFLYLLGADGFLTKLIGGELGLVALLSPTGRYIFYSTSGTGILTTGLLDTQTGKRYESPLTTLADKCTWFLSEPLLFCGIPEDIHAVGLESWLLGFTNSKDTLWVIDPIRGEANTVLNPADEAGVPIDVLAPSVSKDGAYALFMNKIDLSLWSVRITE
jgi:hypothetical protein